MVNYKMCKHLWVTSLEFKASYFKLSPQSLYIEVCRGSHSTLLSSSHESALAMELSQLSPRGECAQHEKLRVGHIIILKIIASPVRRPYRNIECVCLRLKSDRNILILSSECPWGSLFGGHSSNIRIPKTWMYFSIFHSVDWLEKKPHWPCKNFIQLGKAKF